MKILKYITITLLSMVFAIACKKGIDPISKVDPGPDLSAPVVNITYPIEGTEIRVVEEVTAIKIELNAYDDIELKSIALQLDGNQIATFNSFVDYRQASEEYIYEGLADGDHTVTATATDLAGKTTTVTVHFKKTTPYVPMEREVFYMPFDGDYSDLVSVTSATQFGTPGFAPGKVKQAYAGAVDSYLTFPTAGMLGAEFSTTFWYKLNGVPARAGILNISNVPPVPVADSTRRRGFRLARENSGTKQNLFVNYGIGTTEVWVNPFFVATASDEWMHIAITISDSKATFYVNGTVVKEATAAGPINWAGCELMSIGSGKPNFSYWEHFSDLSLMDELRIFNKALSADEVNQIYTMK